MDCTETNGSHRQLGLTSHLPNLAVVVPFTYSMARLMFHFLTDPIARKPLAGQVGLLHPCTFLNRHHKCSIKCSANQGFGVRAI
jgi:hypothetical protein